MGDWGRVEQSELPKREWFQPRRTLAFFQLARETTVWSTWEQKANSEKGNNLTFELDWTGSWIGSAAQGRSETLWRQGCKVKHLVDVEQDSAPRIASLFYVGTKSLQRAPCTDELGDFRSWIHVFMMHIYIYMMLLLWNFSVTDGPTDEQCDSKMLYVLALMYIAQGYHITCMWYPCLYSKLKLEDKLIGWMKLIIMQDPCEGILKACCYHDLWISSPPAQLLHSPNPIPPSKTNFIRLDAILILHIHARKLALYLALFMESTIGTGWDYWWAQGRIWG